MDTPNPTNQTIQPTNRERFEATLRERGLPEPAIAEQVARYYPRTKTK